MTRRSRLLLGMSHIFFLILMACTQGTVADGIGDQTTPSTDSVRGASQERIGLAVGEHQRGDHRNEYRHHPR